MGAMGEISNIFGGNSGPTDQANKAKLNQMQAAAQNYQAYRPEAAQARMNALSNRMQAYQGANNALASMYGAQNAQAPNQALRNPMSNSMMGLPPGEANRGAAGSFDSDHTIFGTNVPPPPPEEPPPALAPEAPPDMNRHLQPSSRGTANQGLGNRKPRGGR